MRRAALAQTLKSPVNWFTPAIGRRYCYPHLLSFSEGNAMVSKHELRSYQDEEGRQALGKS